MAQTYSTLRREAANGRVYSSQYSSMTAVPPLRRGPAQPPAQAMAAPATPAPAMAALATAALAAAPAAVAPPAMAAPAMAAPATAAPAVAAPAMAAPATAAPAVAAPVVQAPVAQAPAPVLQAPALLLPAVTAPAAPPVQAPTPAAPPVQAPTPAAAPPAPSPAVLQAAAAIAQSLGLPPPALPSAQAAAVPAIARSFNLTGSGLPSAAHIAPAGASGTLTLAVRPDGGQSVTGTVQGVRTLTDPVLRPVAWLIHDLTVPHDLTPGDLAALPKGSARTGNQPGGVFTLDGNAPTYTPNCNTVSICISPGSFKLEGDGAWRLDGAIDAGTNLTFHPLVFLGPGALSDINAPMPSGTTARILTDLFMRPASVHPELNARNQFPQRLMAIVRDVLGSSAAPSFLSPDRFIRAAVAVEGIVRSTPSLMPSRETTFLLANQPVAG